MEKKQFLFLMSRLVAAFPNESMTEDRFELYFEFLGNEKPDRLSNAINEIISESKWFPKISELKDKIYPPLSKDDEYLRFLDRKNKEYADSMKPAIEYFSKDEAKQFIGELHNHIEGAERKKAEEREVRFQEQKKILKEQKKIVLGRA